MDTGGKNQAGLTLIELMVAVAVLVIVLSLSTPLMNFVTGNRITGFVQQFVTDLNFARSEAITEGAPISLCIANEALNACTAVGAGARGNWENGWLIFSDANGNGAIDVGDGDTILRVQDQFGAGFTLGVNGIGVITYLASGITTPASNGNWELCDPNQENNFRRRIDLGITGRVSILDNIAADAGGIVLNCTVVP